jgi:predicted RNA methylase
MKELLKQISPDFMKNIYRFFKRKQVRKRAIKYLEDTPAAEMNDEKQEVLDYLNANSFSFLPYPYVKKYSPNNIRVCTDELNGMKYVLLDGKRLYFKRKWSEKEIQESFNDLLKEQDTLSPHRYESDEFKVEEKDVVADVGAGEGNFSLSVVERASGLYLFEPDIEWIDPLHATFAPWKDKVYIVNNCVSDIYVRGGVILDDFFRGKKIDFIKADIEGAEAKLLAGAKRLLSEAVPLKIALCTYHKHNDAEILNRMLKENGFHTEFSRGYVMYYAYDNLFARNPLNLRKCLIRATKF